MNTFRNGNVDILDKEMVESENILRRQNDQEHQNSLHVYMCMQKEK